MYASVSLVRTIVQCTGLSGRDATLMSRPSCGDGLRVHTRATRRYGSVPVGRSNVTPLVLHKKPRCSATLHTRTPSWPTPRPATCKTPCLAFRRSRSTRARRERGGGPRIGTGRPSRARVLVLKIVTHPFLHGMPARRTVCGSELRVAAAAVRSAASILGA